MDANSGSRAVFRPEDQAGYKSLVSMVQARFDAEAADKAPSEEEIAEYVRKVSTIVPDFTELETAQLDAVIEHATEYLLTQINTTQVIGKAVTLDYVPWLENMWDSHQWHFWETYLRMLRGQSRPRKLLRTLEDDVKTILDLVGDPTQDGHWQRRGLVMGDVQSGKTSNFIGLMNMAADAGYRLFIVIGGHTEELRSQTQIRVDEGFIGARSMDSDGRNHVGKRPVGVGHLREQLTVISLTTPETDFVESSRGVVDLGDLETTTQNAPIVLVVKKNSKILANLADWLGRMTRREALSVPMLFIDDEADYASVNTNKQEAEEATAVNRAIRRILERSYKATYVGFTATPFANVLINPEEEDDLFPKDFIYSLYPPSNYMGAHKYFGDERDKFARTHVQDAQGAFPYRHRASHQVPALPESLKRAIDTFIIASTITDLQHGSRAARSMLVNVSRFKGVQAQVHRLIDEYLEDMINVVTNLDPRLIGRNSENPVIARLREAWEREYSGVGPDWEEVVQALPGSIAVIETELINGDTAKERAEAADRRARSVSQRGRRYIAVGGTILSRGLTLDGLVVSYFHQRTQLSDSLLQMGRWFGYRDAYEDLVRIWLPVEVMEWFLFTADTLEEIRRDVSIMKVNGMTPSEFGLKIQKHPEALKVTAANKMRHADQAHIQVSFDRQSVETKTAAIDEESTSQNREAVYDLISLCEAQSRDTSLSTREVSSKFKGHHAYTHVDPLAVSAFLEAFATAPRDSNFVSNDRDGSFVTHYVREMNARDAIPWDVVVIAGKGDRLKLGKQDDAPWVLANRRNKVTLVDSKRPYIEFANRRVATGSNLLDVASALDNGAIRNTIDERMGAPEGPGQKPSESEVLQAIQRPILMIYPIQSHPAETGDHVGKITLPASRGVLGLKLAFPPIRDADGRIVERRGGTPYVVNQVWMKASGLAEDQAAMGAGDDDE